MSASTLPTTARRLLVAGAVTLALLAALFVALSADVEGAGLAGPPAQEIVIPMAPADEGGDGLSGAGASEWIPLAVLLGPAAVLLAGVMWLTFRIDADQTDDD